MENGKQYLLRLSKYKEKLEHKERLQEQVVTFKKMLEELGNDRILHKDVSFVLAQANTEQQEEVLGHIKNLMNATLLRFFPESTYDVEFVRTTHGESNTHLSLQLYETKRGDRFPLDFNSQMGDGISQVIGFMFTLCVIEIVGARPIVIFDEVLKGVHPKIRPLITELIEAFAKKGMQFFMVDYDYYPENINGIVKDASTGNSSLKKFTKYEYKRFEAEGLFKQGTITEDMFEKTLELIELEEQSQNLTQENIF